MGDPHGQDEDHMRARLMASMKKKGSSDAKSVPSDKDTSNIVIRSFAEIMRQKKAASRNEDKVKDKPPARKRTMDLRTKQHESALLRKQPKSHGDALPSSASSSAVTRGRARRAGQPLPVRARPQRPAAEAPQKPIGEASVSAAPLSLSSAAKGTASQPVSAAPTQQPPPPPAMGDNIADKAHQPEPSPAAAPAIAPPATQPAPSPAAEAPSQHVAFQDHVNALTHQMKLAQEMLDEFSKLPDPEFHGPAPDSPPGDEDPAQFMNNMSDFLDSIGA